MGYGPGQGDVEDAVRCLSPDVAAHIELTGKLSTDELMARYQSAQLCIGVAGALLKGASCALPSIKMAHYTTDCEGFGFIEDEKGLVPDSPPTNMVDLIESVITMPANEYLKHSVSAYEVVHNAWNFNPEYLFEQGKRTSEFVSPVSVAKMRILYSMRLLEHKILAKGLFDAPSPDEEER